MQNISKKMVITGEANDILFIFAPSKKHSIGYEKD